MGGRIFIPHDLDTICLHHTGGTIHSKRILKRELHKLEISGLAREYDNGNWAITQRGLDKMGSIFFDDGGEYSMSPQLEIQLIAILVATSCALPGGVFLILREMAMMADAISHTILLGIVLAFFL